MEKKKFFDKRNKFSSNKRSWQRKPNKTAQDKPYKKRDFIQQEQLKEVEVGITEYISKFDGFSAIIKGRYSDFQVNEINLDGEIAKLTTTKFPDNFYEGPPAKLPEDLHQIPKPTSQITEEQWHSIINIITSNEDSEVQVEVTNFTKADRTDIHLAIKTALAGKIVASTIVKDDKKFVQFRKDKGTRDRRMQWPANKGEYVYFLVYKEAVDTLQATLKISDSLRMKAAHFSYAGVKDRRAKTTQWFCARKVDPRKLILATKYLRNIHIGNLTFKDAPLKLGQLQGNRFRIALRNVTAEDELIEESLESLKNLGFINYYGLQRFGNHKEVPTYDVGIQLLLGNWKEACNLILKFKKEDEEDSDVTKAKKIYQETSDAKKAYEAFDEHKNKCVEAKLLYGLSTFNANDYVNSLEQIPRNMRLLYIHSFQSLVWNKVVSRRIKEYGLKPVVGDLVLVSGNENVGFIDECVLSSDNSDEEESSTESSARQEVKILTEEDLENYTMHDVVLPQPGYDIKYPANEALNWYKELLEEVGLSLEMPKQKVRTYTLSGAYRKVLEKVQNLSWESIRYNNPTDNLIQSDYEELRGFDGPVNNPDGAYKALVVDFCLKSSSYATMVLREILKTDTSSAEHSKLYQNHLIGCQSQKKKEEAEAVDYNKPKSLLSDLSKFSEFQKAVFAREDAAAEKRSRSEPEVDEDATEPKKLKTDDEQEDSTLKVQPTII